MNSVLYRDFAEKIWGADAITNYQYSEKASLNQWQPSEIYDQKVQLAKDNLSFLQVFDLVKFIGISGSIAARTVKVEDDIDIFVVVKNDTAWIYRFLIWVKNFRSERIRRENILPSSNISNDFVKDKFCVNFVVEERAIDKIGNSEFVMHELYSLIPLFNEKYWSFMISQNEWLADDFDALIVADTSNNLRAFDIDVTSRSHRNFALSILNFLLFSGQLVYQLIHFPNIKRIIRNYKKGVIAYFPEEFKGHKSLI